MIIQGFITIKLMINTFYYEYESLKMYVRICLSGLSWTSKGSCQTHLYMGGGTHVIQACNTMNIGLFCIG